MYHCSSLATLEVPLSPDVMMTHITKTGTEHAEAPLVIAVRQAWTHLLIAAPLDAHPSSAKHERCHAASQQRRTTATSIKVVMQLLLTVWLHLIAVGWYREAAVGCSFL
jgi:hypothetical protein